MRVPLVLLTGFLGSGKTTLVNRLLARRAQRNPEPGASPRLGVIVNELGEIDIDGALLASGETRQINLPGGCVCCVLGDDLDRTLIELVDANPELDAIVLETTGVAEPLPIAWALARTPVSERVRLAAVVTLVDATTFRSSRAVSGAVDAQVAYADVLLVTKSELAGPAETLAVESEIRTLASRSLVRIGTTDDHADWLEDVLADPMVEHAAAPEPRSVQPRHTHAPGAPHTDECRHLDNSIERTAHGIDSVWVPVPGVVDLEELEDQLGDLPANYVRVKGIIRAVDGRVGQTTATWMAVHRVGLRVSSEPFAPPTRADKPPEVPQARMVALGPGVQRAKLVACVERATASATH